MKFNLPEKIRPKNHIKMGELFLIILNYKTSKRQQESKFQVHLENPGRGIFIYLFFEM